MISVSNVSMRYGAKVLFEDVTTTFIAGRRYGLTGPNGSGKSTFMKVLAGDLDAQKGNVVRPKKVGVLKQDQYVPQPVEKQVAIIYAGVNGFVDDIPVDSMKKFESRMGGLLTDRSDDGEGDQRAQ